MTKHDGCSELKFAILQGVLKSSPSEVYRNSN